MQGIGYDGSEGGVSDVAQANLDAPLHHNRLNNYYVRSTLAGFLAASYTTLEIVDQLQNLK